MHSKNKKQDADLVSTGKQTKRQQAESYLTDRYNFRFNELTGAVEWSEKLEFDFVDLNDYRLNSFCRELDSSLGLTVGADTLSGFLKSDFVSSYHPVKNYFNNLPEVSGRSAIEQLANTVYVENPELFKDVLTRWLIAAIANAYHFEDCQNQTCLVLTGQQGTFKTTWLNYLCPPILSKCLFTGKIDLQSKDTYSLLASKFIINLDDQLKVLNKRDAETVKTLITHGNITLRRPYDQLFSYYPRLASFCASINGSEFLTDSTGSRRFFPFEVSKIDIDMAKTIDIDQVWAEAYALYKSGAKYWYTTEETTELFGSNEAFQVQTPEMEMLTEYYRPIERDKAVQCLTSTQILNELQAKSKTLLREKQLGEALRKMQFERFGRKRNGITIYVYAVQELTESDRTLDQRDFWRAEIDKVDLTVG